MKFTRQCNKKSYSESRAPVKLESNYYKLELGSEDLLDSSIDKILSITGNIHI